jgi:ribosomal protein L19
MTDFPKDLHEKVHISTIRAGDTVMIDGQLKTVGKKDIRRNNFTGVTLWGDSHKLGRDPITRVIFGAEIARQSRQ